VATKIGSAVISNSHRSFRFEIKKNDILNGQPNDPCGCAAARALKRTFNAKEVYVFRDVTYVVSKEDDATRYKTSPALRLETIVFDRNGNFYPGEYDLYPAPDAPARTTRSAPSSSRRRNVRSGVRHTIPNVRPTASQKLPRL